MVVPIAEAAREYSLPPKDRALQRRLGATREGEGTPIGGTPSPWMELVFATVMIGCCKKEGYWPRLAVRKSERPEKDFSWKP